MTPTTVNISRFELLMDAGFGAQKAGDILIRGFAHTGRHVYIEPMIPAEISPPPRSRPALSGVIIRVAKIDLKNIGNETDIMIAQHEVVLDRRLDDEEHSSDLRVLLDIGDQKSNPESYEQVLARVKKEGIQLTTFEITDKAAEMLKKLGGKGKNMYYIGMLSAIYNMPEDVMIKEINDMFGKRLKDEILQANLGIFFEGYNWAKAHCEFSIDIPKDEVERSGELLIDGNTALSMGIIDAGFKLISGYPITPASSILHTLAKSFPSYGGMVHQAEDEISAIGTAVGAYFGGVPAITASSGPGISLKQEFIGYATVSETPIVIIDVQRSGPSTGMPTKTEQSDLLAAIYGSHGDNTKVVIGVGNILDCFYAPTLARYLTEKLRVPVFIMSDFVMANSYKVIKKPKMAELGEDVNTIPDFILDHFWIDRLPDDIEMVRTSQSVPGTPGEMRRTTGLNTDKSGKVNYFAKTNQRSHEIRNEKIHHVQRALKEPELFGTCKEGDVLVIGWGTTRGVIAEAVHKCQDEGLAVSGMVFRIVHPLPLMLKDIFKRFKKVVTVEMAYGDQYKETPLAMFLRSMTLTDVTPMLCRATGRPFTPRLIRQKVKQVIKSLK